MGLNPTFPPSQPLATGGGAGDPRYFKEYPFIATGAAGTETAGGVLLDRGALVVRLGFASAASLMGFRWFAGINYLYGSGEDGILGPDFNYPQNIYLECKGSPSPSPSGSPSASPARSPSPSHSASPSPSPSPSASPSSSPSPCRTVALHTGENTLDVWQLSDSVGRYLPLQGNNNSMAELFRTGSGPAEEFQVIGSQGTLTRFFGFHPSIATPGRVKSITDRYGNTQRYTWAAQWVPAQSRFLMQLTSVTDPYGRVVIYSYFGGDPNGGYHLREITDFLGRKMTCQYDTNGRLAAVVLPSINSAAGGNQFSNGTAYVFDYDAQGRLIKVWYPNQCSLYVGSVRQVDFASVRLRATPRKVATYNAQNRISSLRLGDGSSAGGTYGFIYQAVNQGNLLDPADPILLKTTVTDRNGNVRVYNFDNVGMPAQVDVLTRGKSSRETGPYTSRTSYNAHNQPLTTVFPLGNSVENVYENESTTIQFNGIPYARRVGLLGSTTLRNDNAFGIGSPRPGSNGGALTRMTTRFFYEPLYNQPCAVIEPRGNPVDAIGTYYTPQNGAAPPTNTDRSRYATITYRDYQKDSDANITTDLALQALLFPLNVSSQAATNIQSLLTFVNSQMSNTTGTGGIPEGFKRPIGDVNGDGRGVGSASHLGSAIEVLHPSVLQVGGAVQGRIALFTTNNRGQATTHLDPEANLTVWVRHPYKMPDGVNLTPGQTSNQQYGFTKEVHVDPDPARVMPLVGATGDLSAYARPAVPNRTNGPGYQDLVTQYPAYDPLGNALQMVDPKTFTTTWQRTEMGEAFQSTAPAPYSFRRIYLFDANRNVIEGDIEDQIVDDGGDPGHFVIVKPTPDDGATANVPMVVGPGGIKPQFFVNHARYDLLDQVIQTTVDATGSAPGILVSSFGYDPNQNLKFVSKPARNSVEYDYDERDLRIAQRVGTYPLSPFEFGAVTAWVYDGNGNLQSQIAPVNRGGAGTSLSVTISRAFGDGAASETYTGDWTVFNTYDGMDRLSDSRDAVGGHVLPLFDPAGRVIDVTTTGQVGGPSPTTVSPSGNQTLSHTLARFDEAGREYESQKMIFVASGVTGAGNNVVHNFGSLQANSTSPRSGSYSLTEGLATAPARAPTVTS
jgi:hypothetical protein